MTEIVSHALAGALGFVAAVAFIGALLRRAEVPLLELIRIADESAARARAASERIDAIRAGERRLPSNARIRSLVDFIESDGVQVGELTRRWFGETADNEIPWVFDRDAELVVIHDEELAGGGRLTIKSDARAARDRGIRERIIRLSECARCGAEMPHDGVLTRCDDCRGTGPKEDDEQ